MRQILRILLNLIAPGLIAGATFGAALGVTCVFHFELIPIGAICGTVIGLALTVPHTVLMEVAHARGLAPSSGRSVVTYGVSGALHGAGGYTLLVLTNHDNLANAAGFIATFGALGLFAGLMTGHLVRLLGPSPAAAVPVDTTVP